MGKHFQTRSLGDIGFSFAKLLADLRITGRLPFNYSELKRFAIRMDDIGLINE